MSPWSRFTGPVFKNTGSVARDHLASERTYLAWTRTGLGFVALGLAVERFSRFDLSRLGETKPPVANEDKDEEPSLGSKILVGFLMTLGTGSILFATKRYFGTLRLLEKGEFRPSYGGVATLGLLTSGMGGAVLAGTARDWYSEREGTSTGK